MGVDASSSDGPDRPDVAQSMAIVGFRGDPDRIRELLLPPPLEPVGDGDLGWAAISESYLPAAREDPGVPIEATEVGEAAIGAPCRYDGDRYTVYPLIFQDRITDGFRRGVNRGIADVAKTRWHETCPGREGISAGDPVAGTASHRGDKLLDLTLEVEEETDADALPEGFFDFVHYRFLPDPLAEGETTGIANDLAAMECPSLAVGSVWEGAATLSFGDWREGLLADLAEEVTAGYHVAMGFDYDGDRVIAEVDGDWGDHVE